MRRLTIAIPDDLHQRLKTIAADRNGTMAVIIREALEKKADAERPRLQFLSIGDSSHTDTAGKSAEERPGIRDAGMPASIGMGDSDSTDTSKRISEEWTPPVSWR